MNDTRREIAPEDILGWGVHAGRSVELSPMRLVYLDAPRAAHSLVREHNDVVHRLYVRIADLEQRLAYAAVSS